jgi:hypothetical protein
MVVFTCRDIRMISLKGTSSMAWSPKGSPKSQRFGCADAGRGDRRPSVTTKRGPV